MPIAVAARRGAVLPEAARPVLRAVRQPDQHRPARAGAADLDAGQIRRRAGATPRAASTRRACRRTRRPARPACSAPTSSWRRRGSPATRTCGSTSYVLDRFRGGLLFYYFGNVDQVSHMMWRARDPEHPAYDAARRRAPRATSSTSSTRGLDAIVGETLARLGPDDLLVVMSDHGFTSWRRVVSPEQLAARQRLPRRRRSRAPEDPGLLRQRGLVAHARLRARPERPVRQPEGREKDGIVEPPATASALVDEIAGEAAGDDRSRDRRAGRHEGVSPRAGLHGWRASRTSRPISSSATRRARAGRTSRRSAACRAR